MMDWEEIKKKKSIWLNLGGNKNFHPQTGYENYIAVDLNSSQEGWTVKHDLRTPLPLRDDSVERILSEDFFEHIEAEDIQKLLGECFRILKQEGFIRIGVPDYLNPKDLPYLKKGKDPRHPFHVTLTHYELIKKIIRSTPFQRVQFYHYWDGDEFVENKIDYALGMVKRTPDHDERCRRVGFSQNIKGLAGDFVFGLSQKFRFSKNEFLSRPGHRLHVTSLVVDLFKK